MWLTVGSALSSCSLKKPAGTTPTPNIQNIPKSFFLKSGGPSGSAFSLEGATSKTFACGWAPETEKGGAAFLYLHNYNYAGHCNIKFKVFEKNLVGYMVNPSLEESKWEPVITIGINKHYYLEKDRDSNGRESNDLVEATRSDWEARPYMTLDLGTVSIESAAMTMFWSGSYRVTGVPEDKVEWDHERNFLGFTVEARDLAVGSDASGSFRFNFMAFDHDPSFEKTPYTEKASQHFNILHILGTRHNGLNKDGLEMYGAKWDVRKTHTVYLNQFPEEYVHIGKEVIELWNDTFEKIYADTGKKVRPFVAKVENLEHALDLRKPAITWVEDKRMAAYGPLGVGMVTADVRNGQVLWGGVTIWGGSIRGFVNHYAPTAASLSSDILKGGIQMGLTNHRDMDQSVMSQQLKSFASGAYVDSSFLLSKAVDEMMDSSNAEKYRKNLEKAQLNELTVKDAVNLRFLLRPEVYKGIEALMGDLAATQTLIQRQLEKAPEILFSSDYIQGLSGNSEKLSQSLKRLESSPLGHLMGLASSKGDQAGSSLSELSPDAISQRIEAGINRQYSTSASFDFERTFDQVASGWSQAIRSGRPLPEVRAAVIKDLLLHEWGHVLGLGHNFKENIIPHDGTVPKHMHDALESLNNEEAGYTQMSTVMGYRSGFTEAVTPYDQIQPGPMDRLVLKYLYLRKYATFKHGDKQATDFEFKDVPADGMLPGYVAPENRRDGQSYVSYFPACNDYFASVGSDPYCRRWDRGGDAVSLVQNKFRELRSNLNSISYSFSDAVNGGDYRWREYYLFVKALRAFGEARVFYDYMRQKYDDSVIRPLISSGVRGEKNMLDFSKACRSDQDHPSFIASEKDERGAQEQTDYESQLDELRGDSESRYLKDIFAKHRELKDLCVAVGIMMHEIRNALKTSGKDYATIDYNNYHRTSAMTGGDVFYSDFNGQDLGQWLELGKWPLKTAAIKALTLPFPYYVWNGWTLPIRRYSRQDGQYLLSTLYPVEFNHAVKSGVIDNLELSQDPNSSSTSNVMNNTVLNLGWSMLWQYYGNDVNKFPGRASYFEMIRRQTQYRFSLSAVIVKKVPLKEDKDITKQLDGQIFNMYTGNLEPLDAVYLTENYKVIGPPPEQSFLYPITPFKVFNTESGYYLAYKMDYDKQNNDVLFTSSIKAELYNSYKRVLDSCIVGEGNTRNGLGEYFNSSNKDFDGFKWQDNVYSDDKALALHMGSITEQFDKYYKTVKGVRPETCSEALKGMGLIVNAAALMNGYWLDAHDYIEHGSRW